MDARPTTVRLTKDIEAALALLAKREDRSVGSLIRQIIIRHLRAEGLLPSIVLSDSMRVRPFVQRASPEEAVI